MSTRVAVYEDGKKAERKHSLGDAYAARADHRAVVWIALVEPSKEELDSVARQFGLQELTQEEEDAEPRKGIILKYQVRGLTLTVNPARYLADSGTVEIGELDVFLEEDTETRKGIILKYQGRRLTLTVSPARYLADSGTVKIGELDVFLEEGLAITISRGEGPEMHDVEQGLEESSDLSRLGAGAILRALLYRVVDDYASVVDGLADDLTSLEADMLEGAGGITKRLYELSREVVRFQRVSVHFEAVLDRLADPDSQDPGSTSELEKRLRGARNHAHWINSRVSGLVALLQFLFNTNLTLVSVQQNAQSRRISAWGAIIAVPTVIASIYGMNFRYMPELELRLGYPFVLLVMVALCIVLYVVFKRIEWL